MADRRWHLLPRLGALVALAVASFTDPLLVSTLRAQGVPPRKFTIDVVDAPYTALLRVLFLSAGKNFTIDPAVRGSVTLDLHAVSYDQALAAVLAAARPPVVLTLEAAGGGVIHVKRITPPDLFPPPYSVGDADDLGRNQDAPAPPAARTEPRLTAAEAVTIAQTFCRKIGQPVSAEGSAVFPLPAEPSLLPSYWQPCWQVTFPGQATVQVADDTGVIASYREDTPFQQHGVVVHPDGLTLMTMTMPRGEALRRAKSAMAATGQPEPAHFQGAGADLEDWECGWRRTYHGIPYEDLDEEGHTEDATATVNAHTGRISWLHYDYSSPPLTGATGRVTEDRAVRTAKAYMAGDPWIAPGSAYSEAKLCVVCLGSGPSRQTHAAWIVTFLDGPTQARHFDDVWIDSQTGRVVNDRHLGFGNHF